MVRILVIALEVHYEPSFKLVDMRASFAENDMLQAEVKMLDLFS